jgi:hypothetical protein
MTEPLEASTSTIAARRLVPPRSQPTYFFIAYLFINSPLPKEWERVMGKKNTDLLNSSTA